jgi:hypothetical protein
MGGDDAPMERSESAKHIRGLYQNIGSLHSGKMYNYDGQVMDW